MSKSSDIALGIDRENFAWQDLALCGNMATNLFYEDYEYDSNVAQVVDQICLSCPVMKQCLEAGMDNGEVGVWGGFYLVSGKVDETKNSHKTPEVMAEFAEVIRGE